jgi:glycine betaine catabolism A
MSILEMNGTDVCDALPRRSWAPGYGLPREYYVDPIQFQNDLSQVFYRNWLFVGHACQIPNPGDYFTFAIGVDSLLIVRDEIGRARALFNICRHRGSRLCEGERGHVNKFVCPYHQWVYGLDGELLQCRLMNDEVVKADYPLHEAHVEVVCGFIFVCLSKTAPNFAPARTALTKFLEPHDAQQCKTCLEIEYDVAANWKTVFENNRECYHCATGHREFCLANFDYGMVGDPRSSEEFVVAMERMQQKWQALGLEAGPVNFPNGEWFRCMRFPLKSGYVTESLDGKAVAPIMGEFPDHDIGSLRVVGLPNVWAHFNSDHFMTTRLVPVSAGRTKIKVAWYVHCDAVEGADYDLDRVVDVWRITSEQDWKLCETNYLGQQSTRYVPGPLSNVTEQGLAQFFSWYMNQLARAVPADIAGDGGYAIENGSCSNTRDVSLDRNR